MLCLAGVLRDLGGINVSDGCDQARLSFVGYCALLLLVMNSILVGRLRVPVFRYILRISLPDILR